MSSIGLFTRTSWSRKNSSKRKRNSRVRMTTRLIQATVTAVAVCCVAGCVRFHAEPLQPAQRAAEFDGRSLANGKMREFVAKNGGTPGDAWGLRELTLAAFYYQPDLDVARAEWSVADASR